MQLHVGLVLVVYGNSVMVMVTDGASATFGVGLLVCDTPPSIKSLAIGSVSTNSSSIILLAAGMAVVILVIGIVSYHEQLWS